MKESRAVYPHSLVIYRGFEIASWLGSGPVGPWQRTYECGEAIYSPHRVFAFGLIRFYVEVLGPVYVFAVDIHEVLHDCVIRLEGSTDNRYSSECY
jgi:hypothetical protein